MNKDQKKLNKLLLLALDENNEKKIIELVNKGADVNAKDRSGDSILMMAVYYGSPELVNFLIEKGADVNYIFYDDNYGLHENRNAIKSAYYAGKTGRMDLVKLLLEKADINLQDKDGGTLLMWAAKRGYTNMLKILLQKGAKLDIKDKMGWNALEWACWSGEREAVKLLREAGAEWVCTFRGNPMKKFFMIIPREEWNEKDSSGVFLFSRLQKGEVPSSPKYIKKMYDYLMKVKEKTKGMKLDFVRIKAPKKFTKEKNMAMYIHNFLSVCAHVFGNSNNGIENAAGDKLEFIMCFEKGN